ncbi:ABC transporter ATP-binding protein [uncultured Tistrella sp.]|uniref:ABC transporter ATP-binding protein n=1 Tax=Tistrella mobilis TaxID=171437 RepID=UPI000C0A46D5|nr:ABC transporter ATP-binding protein [uncultured Tistrella sp.]MAM74030.1 ABC transporter ATP-binding protein [Tistrella sp.]
MNPSSTTPSRLILDDIVHAYDGRVAVDHVSVGIAAGEILCLLGPSGCGKTTCLRLAAGLEDVQHGRVIIDGRTVAEPGRAVKPEARGVGLVFQDYALFPHLTVRDNVGFGLRQAGAAERRRRSEALLDLVGLGGRGGDYPHMMSGGEQQRVALARALAPEPQVMLLDEPFSGLDIALRDRLCADTLAVLREVGAAALMVTHDPDEALRMGDRIAVMNGGRIVQAGYATELYQAPATPFVARLFGELNVVSLRVAGGRVSTPLGPLPAPGFADGAAVTVMIRPEALIEDASGVIEAEVVEVRALGPVTALGIRVAGWPGRLGLRLGGVPRHGRGDRLRLALDLGQTFVFAADGR